MTTRTEEFKVSGNDIVQKLKEIIQEGNVRRISVKNKEGRIMAEFPLAIGLIGTMVAPVVAAIGTMLALATECTISVEREVLPEKKDIAQTN